MTRIAVDKVLDAFHGAAARADADALFACLAPDAVFLGTDATERWAGQAFRDYVLSRFAAGTGWTMTPTRREVTFRGDSALGGAERSDVAWFDEDLSHVRMGQLRGSGVVARDGSGAWRIEQFNLTVTVPNDRFDELRDLLARGSAS